MNRPTHTPKPKGSADTEPSRCGGSFCGTFSMCLSLYSAYMKTEHGKFRSQNGRAMCRCAVTLGRVVANDKHDVPFTAN